MRLNLINPNLQKQDSSTRIKFRSATFFTLSDSFIKDQNVMFKM
jgi:hypothetical protein